MKENKTEWKSVVGYEGLYDVSSDGQVRNARTKRILNPSKKNQGYLYVVLSMNSVRKSKNIHRIVAEAFLENKKLKSDVNHINGIKTDNRLENLEWLTRKENVNHAWSNGLCENGRESKSKEVLDLQTGVFYESLVIACNTTLYNYGRAVKHIFNKDKRKRFQYV